MFHRAVVKSTVVYSLPVYEKLSEVGFGTTEVNRFLHKVNRITLILEGNEISSNRYICVRLIFVYYVNLNILRLFDLFFSVMQTDLVGELNSSHFEFTYYSH